MNVMEDKSEQPAKAFAPIDVTPSGITKLPVNPWHVEKTQFPIVSNVPGSVNVQPMN